MKKIFLFLLLIFCSTVFAEPLQSVVFFGDSLTDNGNLYKVVKLPKSPPYFAGRFSNGLTWADNLGDYYFHKYGTSTSNYAVGWSATAILHNPFDGYLPYDISAEVTSYLKDTFLLDRSNTLFIIWIGANDYLSDAPKIDKATTDVVNATSSAITRLIRHGGKKFLVLNLPDLAATPYAQTVTYKDNLHNLSVMHNQKLLDKINELKTAYPNAEFTLLDVFTTVNDILQNPEKYNQQYNKHLTNTNEACWTGGYTLKNAKSRMTYDLQKVLTEGSHKFDIQPIVNSPSVAEAYAVGEAFDTGVTPCETPDQFFFWDHVHPPKSRMIF